MESTILGLEDQDLGVRALSVSSEGDLGPYSTSTLLWIARHGKLWGSLGSRAAKASGAAGYGFIWKVGGKEIMTSHEVACRDACY